uniref:BED-type domain-containing protein n=1 Tax=Clastoptera arizonana TaxID=38151 RepID=A0A1B6EC01_9HEMI
MKDTHNKNRRSSFIWKYFTTVGDENLATCNLCYKTFYWKSTTSNLKKHFMSKHKHFLLLGKNFNPIPNTVGNDNPITLTYKIAEEKEFENVEMEYEVDSNRIDEEETEEEIIHLSPMSPNKLILPKKSVTRTPMSIKTVMPTQKKLKVHQSGERGIMINEAMNILKHLSQTESGPEYEDEDEFTQFGKYLISQLRQLPLVNALQLLEKFQSLLTRERIILMSKSNDIDTGLKSCIQQHQCNQTQNCGRSYCVVENTFSQAQCNQCQKFGNQNTSQSAESIQHHGDNHVNQQVEVQSHDDESSCVTHSVEQQTDEEMYINHR